MIVASLILTLVVTSIVAKVEIPEDLQEFIDEIHGECLQQMSLTEDDHKKFEIHNKDPKMMCYLRCLMLTSKWMKPDGTIDYDHITDSAHEKIKHLLIPAVNKCRHIEEGTQECEKPYNFNLCMSEADPENWFIV